MTSPQPEFPPLPVHDPEVRTRHLLALPDGVGVDELEVLAISRFPAAAWETMPGVQVRRSGGGRGARSLAASTGVLRVSRLSTLTGPYSVTSADAVSLGLPAVTTTIYDVRCPRERGEPPYPGGDRDGLKRAFADAMPVREEERVLLWLVAAARRLGGAVRTGERGVVLRPDLDATIDLTVFTDRWLEPDELLAVVQHVVPRARLAMEGVPWHGPADDAGRRAASGLAELGVPEPGGRGLRKALERHGVSDERRRRHLAAEADAFDGAVLSEPVVLEGYGALVDLGVDGMIAVEVGGEEALPPLLRGLPWAAGGALAYRVRWEPTDVEELELERPSFAHRVARGRAMPHVHSIARALQGVVGGEIADAGEFLINPGDL
ncbi:MAG: hypothetical protein HHJ10_12200 [Cellulomonas sp.]|uniref:hypothetical protein n=1 Tax=Cellulomonas sp. TaxID=40001 RepID=UPI00184DA55B|nr:hypothetical protein [Cellulomonas sp.]NMM31765.1 hypothetical protein [Cellulomonas sp.]